MTNRKYLCAGMLLLLLYAWENFQPKGMIVGTYISNAATSFLADSPGFGDSLVLQEDNRFTSSYWGDGTYEIEYSWKGTLIHLTYKIGNSTAGYSSYFYRPFFLGKPRIEIFRDLDYYFRKVN